MNDPRETASGMAALNAAAALGKTRDAAVARQICPGANLLRAHLMALASSAGHAMGRNEGGLSTVDLIAEFAIVTSAFAQSIVQGGFGLKDDPLEEVQSAAAGMTAIFTGEQDRLNDAIAMIEQSAAALRIAQGFANTYALTIPKETLDA